MNTKFYKSILHFLIIVMLFVTGYSIWIGGEHTILFLIFGVAFALRLWRVEKYHK